MKSVLLLLGLIIITMPLALATEMLDQQQTQGGNFFDFYVTSDNSHSWAAQQFQPTMSSLTKVELSLRLNYPGSTACQGANNKIDVEIWSDTGSNGFDNAVATASSVNLCPLFSSYYTTQWVSIPLSQSATIDITKKHWIKVTYRGWQTGYSAFDWQKASSDVKPDLIYKLPGGITGTHDFTFKTYGNPVTCTTGWKCKDTYTKAYQNSDCSWSSISACSSSQICSGGACVANAPNMNIQSLTITNNSGRTQDNFSPGDGIMYQANVQNTWKSGQYSIEYRVTQNSAIVQGPRTDSYSIAEGGQAVAYWQTNIPLSWNGAYTLTAAVTSCDGGNTCTSTKTFSVLVTCTTDNDHDGYYADCSPLDCDDTNPHVTQACEPVMNLTQVTAIPTSLQPGELLTMRANAKNLGSPGNFFLDFTILKDGNALAGSPWGNSYPTNTNEEKTIELGYTIHSDWIAGEYQVRSRIVGKCSAPQICTLATPFALGEACVDADEDSYGLNCDQGDDCNDNSAAINPHSIEVPCDQQDNDCRAETADSTCATGLSCDYESRSCVASNGQSCLGGSCSFSLDTTPDTWVLVQSPLFFNYFYPYIMNNHNANTFFFQNESEDFVEQFLTSLRNDPYQTLGNIDSLRSFVVYDGEKFFQTVSSVRNVPVKMTFMNGDDIYIATYDSVYFDEELGQSLGKSSKEFRALNPEINLAGNHVPLIDLGMAIIITANETNPAEDPLKYFFTLPPTLPMMPTPLSSASMLPLSVKMSFLPFLR